MTPGRRPAAWIAVWPAWLLGVSLSTGRSDAADDHAVAIDLVDKLGKGAPAALITSEAVAHAQEALERATRLRGAGDESHAKAADGLAREWAETARDVARAAEVEEKAAEFRRKAVAAQERLERTRALIAEGIARAGRLRAQLEEASRAAASERRAVETHDGDKSRPVVRAVKK